MNNTPHAKNLVGSPDAGSKGRSAPAGSLLKHHVGNLRLKQDAAFPRESQDTKDMIKSWQRLQRMHLVRGERNE